MQVKDLKPADYNPRKITNAQLDRLRKSLEEFGDLSGIVFNVRTQTLIGGHQRAKNFDPSWPIIKKPQSDKTGTVALGYVETESGRMTYREVDWPEEKEKMANIAANKQGGEFDDEKLKLLLEEIPADTINVDLMGFSEEELSDIMQDVPSILEYDEKEIQPYHMTHVLLSFPPEKQSRRSSIIRPTNRPGRQRKKSPKVYSMSLNLI